MKTSQILALALGLIAGGASLTSTGCAKKKAPEAAAPGANFAVDIGKVELLRQSTITVREKNELRYTLRLTNGLTGGAVTVDKIDFSFGIGERELGSESNVPNTSVAAGEMGKVTLIGHFDWSQDAEMPAGEGWVKGTVNWTGPNASRSTPFEFSKEYSVGE